MRPIALRALALASLIAAPAFARNDNAPIIYREGFLTIRSEMPMTPQQGKQILDRVNAAYAFDRGVAQWRSDRLLYPPLTVKVLGAASLAGQNLLGEARGHDLFVVALDYLSQPLSEGTLAHELTHIQDGRNLGQLGTGRIPHYVLEGRALLIGHAYRQSRGLTDHDYDRKVTASLAKVNANDVRQIIQTEAYMPEHQMGNRFRMEAVGMLFVEWLRTRAGGRGFADVQARLSRIMEEVGAGQTFEASFARMFGMPLQQAQEALIALVAQTQGQPAARLANTVPGLYLR
jgi:hypothetical protein